jgi:hypothetical protein
MKNKLYLYILYSAAAGWTFAGYVNKDKAIMTNFGLQLPLFVIGYINLFF